LYIEKEYETFRISKKGRDLESKFIFSEAYFFYIVPASQIAGPSHLRDCSPGQIVRRIYWKLFLACEVSSEGKRVRGRGREQKEKSDSVFFKLQLQEANGPRLLW